MVLMENPDSTQDLYNIFEKIGTKEKEYCVFLYINQGFTHRYLLRSDVYKYLLKSEVKLVIISPNANETGFRERYESANVSVEYFDDHAYERFLQKSRIQRLLIDLRNFVVNGKRGRVDTVTVDDYKTYFLAGMGWTFGTGIKGGIIGCIFNFGTYLLKKSGTLRRLLIQFESKRFVPGISSALFNKYMPDLAIVSALGGFKYNELFAREAIQNNVPVCCVVLSWDNTSGNGMPGYKPNYVIAWTDKMRKELIELNDIEQSCIRIGGVPHWDSYYTEDFPMTREETCKSLGLDEKKMIVVYATKSPKRFPWGPSLVSDLANAIEDGRIIGPTQLLVRIHPLHFRLYNGEVKFQAIVDEYFEVAERHSCVILNIPKLESKVIHFDLADNETRLLASILRHSSVMVNMFSTMQIEAAIFDLPVINMAIKSACKGDVEKTKQDITIDFRQRHNQSLLESGGVRTVFTMDEFLDSLNVYLKHPETDREGRKRLRINEAGPYPGSAGKMIAKHILCMLDDDLQSSV